MIYQQLQVYIKQHLTEGVGKDIIINSLIDAGWKRADVEDSFNLVDPTYQSPAESYATSSSKNIITDKKYPIEFRWIFTSSMRYILFFLVLMSLLYLVSSHTRIKFSEVIKGYLPFFLILLAGFIIRFLKRATFHYSIEDKFLTLKQGIFKKEQRHIPYGVIQNVFVKQGFFDRIFGLASLSIENASEGAVGSGSSNELEMVGFSGNTVSIPGLNKSNAETLKNIVLQKMKENPIDDRQSGL